MVIGEGIAKMDEDVMSEHHLVQLIAHGFWTVTINETESVGGRWKMQVALSKPRPACIYMASEKNETAAAAAGRLRVRLHHTT